MKRLFILLVMFFALGNVTGYEWQGKDVVDEFFEATRYPIQAMAICTDKADMAKVARVNDIERYFYSVITLEKEETVEKDQYIIIYCTPCTECPRIIGLIYRKEGVCEIYYIY